MRGGARREAVYDEGGVQQVAHSAQRGNVFSPFATTGRDATHRATTARMIQSPVRPTVDDRIHPEALTQFLSDVMVPSESLATLGRPAFEKQIETANGLETSKLLADRSREFRTPALDAVVGNIPSNTAGPGSPVGARLLTPTVRVGVPGAPPTSTSTLETRTCPGCAVPRIDAAHSPAANPP